MSIVRIKIPETVVPGRPLGRHIFIDSRSADYSAQTAPELVSVSHHSKGLPLDQGQIGSCTANALVGALNTTPHYTHGAPTLAEPAAVTLYSAETALEGQPYPPNDPGGSGTEVCKAAMNAGMISAYQHATGIDAALAALVLRPGITGVNWFTSFDTPDANGLVAIAKKATVRGGHEFVAVALDVVNELVWFCNSWGLVYGVALACAGIAGGCFCMRWSTWETLLAQGGDVTVPRTAPGWHA
jgi:hypothetical protein